MRATDRATARGSELVGEVRARVERVPDAWRRAAVATAGLWGLVLLLTVVAAGTLPSMPFTPDPPAPGFPGWPPPAQDATGWALVSDALVRFDALYYLGIAADGYPAVPANAAAAAPSASAFFPLYPALVAAVGLLTGGRLVAAATLVSTAATVVALAGVHRLVEELVEDPAAPRAHERSVLLSEDAPRRAVLVTALFPTSFFLLAPYAESTHLAAVVWSLVAALRGRDVVAGMLGAAAAASRPVGVLLAAPLLVLPGAGDRPPSWPRRLVRAAGPPLGLAAVLAVAWVATGSPLAPLDAQARWQRVWQLPTETVAAALHFAFGDVGGALSGYQLLDVLVVVVAIVSIGVLWWWTLRAADRRRRLVGHALLIHGIASVGVWLVQSFPGRPLMSAPRFALVVPAVLVGLAVATRSPAAERGWVVTSAVLLGVHLVLFSRWWFVF